MADAAGSGARVPQVYTIALHRSFADSLADGLLRRFGAEPASLARGLVLLPNARAIRSVTDAFVRRAGAGLLLPRLVAIGDDALDEAIGAALDPADDEEPVRPAVEPLRRQMLLARLVAEARSAAGRPVGAAEAVRLADDLARVRDQLLIERVEPSRLADAVVEELSGHWQTSLAELRLILDRWPAELARIGRIDLAERRDRLLMRAARRWREAPPAAFTVAAGITVAAPAVAALLRTIARMETGLVVLPGLDRALPRPVWDALGPHEPDPVTGRARQSIETHPQFGLKLLLDRMGIARDEVRTWRGRGTVAPAIRTRAVGNALLPPAFTGQWQELKPGHRRLPGISTAIFAAPADEAQAIAVALRGALETPGRTAALITPDRALARRVSAHLRRWGIEADDSAGRPLWATPPGALILALADAAAERFAPVPLLAVLKHPLVRAGEGRLAWLEGVRRLDRAMRAPRPPAGLDAIGDWLAAGTGREAKVRDRALGWWSEVAPLLAPLETAFATGTLGMVVAALREAADALCGEAVWSGVDGRALADLFMRLEESAADAPAVSDPAEVQPILRTLMDAVAVRPPAGGHPRVFIWGLIEARLQHADLHVLGGLNEGSWPAAPAPDPWLAPRIRRSLGLPGLERRVGVAAHDFASALGGGRVLVTRARRSPSGPTVASRFWLRLEAMTGGLTRDHRLPRWAGLIDRPDRVEPAPRPAPSPPADARPRAISVTAVDRLKADPFAFYARSVLRLSPWDPIDADPGPAWRGQIVHALLERWLEEDGADPRRLRARADALFAGNDMHPMVRALWQPRLSRAIDWIAAEVESGLDEGRRPIAAEVRGEIEMAGVTLEGIADRIDRLADGGLAIVDYKTGTPPRTAAVAAGYAMQLGLLGFIAEQGGFPGIAGKPGRFEYWSLAKKGDQFGHLTRPSDDKAAGAIPTADFPARAAAVFAEAAGRWLTGSEPFTAKLHPEYAPYGEYDQLMRLDEWYGRD